MKQRLRYLDFLRCWAICMVIVLHAMTPVLTNTQLYGTRTWLLCMLQNSFNRTGVPLFFMISGYLMLRDERTLDIGGFYQKHLPRIAVPLLVWNLIYLLPSVLSGGEELARLPGRYLATLINNGSSYHFWFVYTLLGIYLITPFLKRMVDGCTTAQLVVLLLIVVFPGAIRPFLNRTFPIYIYLFDPLMESYLGYFLLGYLLGSRTLSLRGRIAVYAGGAAGYALGVWGNMSTASAEGIPLPYNGGYNLNHYLLAAALFVFFRALFQRMDEAGHSGGGAVLAVLSDAVFGIYWCHVLVLNWISQALGAVLTLAQLLCVQVLLTAVIAFLVMAALSRVPVLRRLIM